MKVTETIFIICLLTLFVHSNAKSLLQNRKNTNKQVAISAIIPEGKTVHLIVELLQENPKAEHVPFNSEGADICGLKKVITEWDISPLAKQAVQENAQKIKSFISKNNLNEQLPGSSVFAYASSEKFIHSGRQFFKSHYSALFSPVVPPKVIERVLTEKTKDELVSTQRTENELELISLMYGHFSKTHGLSMNFWDCPLIKRNMIDNRFTNTAEYKAMLSISGNAELIRQISDLVEKTTFIGRAGGETWVFKGEERPLQSKPFDMLLFLETVKYNSQFRNELECFTKDQWDGLLKFREHFIKFYMKEYIEFIGKRFSGFTNWINSEITYVSGFPGVVPKGSISKKWLTIGINDITHSVIKEYILMKFNLELGDIHEYANSVLFAFIGSEKDIESVFIFNTNFEKIGEVRLADWLKASEAEIFKKEEFSKICGI